MINQKNYDIRGDGIAQRSVLTLKKDQDKQFTKNLGRSMRFFLNLSFALIIAFPVFILIDSQWATPVTMIAYFIAVILTILFFIAFLWRLMRIEKYATQKRNIELVSRVICEFNRSSLIRLAIGKIPTFTEEE